MPVSVLKHLFGCKQFMVHFFLILVGATAVVQFPFFLLKSPSEYGSTIMNSKSRTYKKYWNLNLSRVSVDKVQNVLSV